MNAFNLLEKKKKTDGLQLMQLYIREKRSNEKKNGRGEKVKKEGMKL